MSFTPEMTEELKAKMGENHIMLSYNWDIQSMVTSVYDCITAKGLLAWMDIKGGVSGNINASMAEGVEGAAVICPFMTEEYQVSESCELELNYAKDCKVIIVPCKAQSRASNGSSYRARGWLGVCTAGKLWLNFKDSSDLEKKVDSLLIEICARLAVNAKPGFTPAAPQADPPQEDEKTPPPAYEEICQEKRSTQPHLTAAWSRVDGALSRVSVGKSGVWGVNSADEIYYRGLFKWERIPGGLCHVSSGSSVWGVNSLDDIYTCPGDGDYSWKLIGGKLTNVDVSNKGHVWGVNKGQQIYRMNGGSWKLMDGAAVQVSVGESGVWVVNKTDDIYYRNGTYGDEDCDGTGWTNVGGKLKWVASGPGIVVGCNKSDEIFYRLGISKERPTGLSWVKVGGRLSVIDVDEGQVWGRNSAMEIYQSPVSIYPGRYILSTWTHMPGKLTRVSTGKAGIWGVNSNDDIFEWSQFNWVHIGGKLVHVAVGDSIWGVNSSEDIYTCPGNGNNNWKQVAGKLTNVDVSNKGHVWGVNKGQQIFRMNGGSWKLMDGAAVQVSVGESGVWVVNKTDDIYYRNGTYGDEDSDGTGWNNVGGKLKWVASGPGIVVGCNKSDEIFYRAGVCKENPTGEAWKKVDGALSQIDAGVESVFGRNAGMDIYQTSVNI